PNVRKARVTINLATGDSGYNGFAADNVSLVLTTDALLGVNLLQNGDTETNSQNEDGYPVPGWNADTYMCAWKYGEYKMPTNADRNGQRGLLQRSTAGDVPSGARSARVDLYFHKLGPVTDNLNAFADNLVFQLDSIQITGVTNAASSQSGAVAPGEFVSVYGN